MVTIVVAPLRDGVDQRGSWQVKKQGMRKDTHTKKSAAVRRARELATKGDVIEIRRTDGSVQDRSRYTGSQTSSGSKTPNYDWDASAIKDEYDSMTDIF